MFFFAILFIISCSFNIFYDFPIDIDLSLDLKINSLNCLEIGQQIVKIVVRPVNQWVAGNCLISLAAEDQMCTDRP